MVGNMKSRGNRNENGGVTILVALMLLVLLTVAAVGMSKNSLRENILAGTARQGTVVRNIADAGLEWSIFWLDDSNVASGSAGAAALQSMANNILINPNLAGLYQALPAGANSDMIMNNVSGVDIEYFDLQMMSTGKLPVAWTSQNAVAMNSTSMALLPDLWAIRADGHYLQGGSVDFVHSREIWVSTKSRSVNQ